jgi:hypothetical protein
MNKIGALVFVLLCSFSDSRSLFVKVLPAWLVDRLCFFKQRQGCTNHSGFARYKGEVSIQHNDRLYSSILSNTPGDVVPVWNELRRCGMKNCNFQNPSFFVQKIKILVRIPFLILCFSIVD